MHLLPTSLNAFKRNMQYRSIKLWLLLSLCTSCQIYRSHFDCPPGQGVPCTPVSTLEKMIMETPEGNPDIFLGFVPEIAETDIKTDACAQQENQKGGCLKRIWIEGTYLSCGSYVEGHYLYIPSQEQ